MKVIQSLLVRCSMFLSSPVGSHRLALYRKACRTLHLGKEAWTLMNLSVDSMYHSLIFVNQLLTVFVPMAKGMLLIHRMKLRNFSDEVRMSSLYQLKNAGIGQELLMFSFSLRRVVQVQIHSSRSVVSCMMSLDLVCLLQYLMVCLASVKLAMKVEMFGSFLLGTKEEGSLGSG